MRVLLDTSFLIWTLVAPDIVPRSARPIISDPQNTFLFSAVSIWEIAIKSALGRPDFDLNSRTILDGARAAGIEELPVTSDAVTRVADLPHHHRDPFDRLLIALAIEEGASLLTADRALAAYGPSVLLAI